MEGSSVVCRGGTCLAENFANGSGVTQNPDGTLNCVSVQCSNNGTLQTVSIPFKNCLVGVTTVANIEAAGGKSSMAGLRIIRIMQLFAV
jgi:hypothetical protein